jgi:hypothetical protein
MRGSSLLLTHPMRLRKSICMNAFCCAKLNPWESSRLPGHLDKHRSLPKSLSEHKPSCLSRSHCCHLSRQGLQGSLITQQSLSRGQASSACLADCRIGGLFAPHPTSALPLHINQFANGQLLMELKFELDTRLTVLCMIAIAYAYGLVTISIVLNSIPLAFANAIVLLAILSILFGLKDTLMRKPTVAIR